MKPHLLSIVRNGWLLIILCSTAPGCSQPCPNAVQYNFLQPAVLPDSIKTAAVRNTGIDSNLLCKMTKEVQSGSLSNVHSILVMKDNKLVYENYFPGKDQLHGRKLGCIEHTVYQLHDCRSVSKLVVSACIGIAIKKGFIKSVEDPVANYIPGIRDSSKKIITIKHLLTMTAGLDWKEIGYYSSFFNSETQMDLRFNPIQYIIKKSTMAAPGTHWHYSGGNTQLLAEIIYRQSGLNIFQFASEYLFTPLSIQNSEWVRLSLKNIPAAASGLRLSSRDMLKLGQLYLNKGNWYGNQMLDSAWIEQSFTSFIERPDLSNYKIKNGGYGFQCWIYKDTINNQPLKIIEAKGNGGQSIFICNQLQLLVVTTGGNYNKADDNPCTVLYKYILPSLMAGRPSSEQLPAGNKSLLHKDR